MAVNTSNLEGYTVFSSVSLNGSGATLQAKDFKGSTLSLSGTATISALSSAKTFIAQEVWASILSGAVKASQLTMPASGLYFSSGTTAQSASTAKVGDGQFIISVLSLTTNGAALYYRSGNSTWVWPSSGAIG